MAHDGWNPYDELGVKPDATQSQVKAAYRKKSKTHHPDAGGTEEGWAKVALAYAILSDKKQRHVFDETGQAEAPKPNNDRAAAMGILDQKMAELINRYLQSGCNEMHDPCLIDVPQVIADTIADELVTARSTRVINERALASMKRMAGKLTRKKGATGEDSLQRMLAAQIEKMEAHIKQLDGAIRCNELARNMAREYGFQPDTRTTHRTTTYYTGATTWG